MCTTSADCINCAGHTARVPEVQCKFLAAHWLGHAKGLAPLGMSLCLDVLHLCDPDSASFACPFAPFPNLSLPLCGCVVWHGAGRCGVPGLCYGKLEAAVLFFIIPSLLLGHLVRLPRAFSFTPSSLPVFPGSVSWGTPGVCLLLGHLGGCEPQDGRLIRLGFKSLALCGWKVMGRGPNMCIVLRRTALYWMVLSGFSLMRFLSSGVQSGVLGADMERPLLGVWVLLSLVFSLRKFTQPLKVHAAECRVG